MRNYVYVRSATMDQMKSLVQQKFRKQIERCLEYIDGTEHRGRATDIVVEFGSRNVINSALERLAKSMRKGDVLFVESMDRLSRDASTCAYIYQMLTNKGCGLIAVGEESFQTPVRFIARQTVATDNGGKNI